MRLKEIIKHLRKLFETKKNNNISLGRDAPLDSVKQPLRVGGKNTPLNISDTDLEIDGNLKVKGNPVPVLVNNPTENELVTVGATTTKLDSEANLTFDGTDLAIASTGKLYFGAGSHTYIHESGDDILSIGVGGTVMLLMQEATLNQFHIKSHVVIDAGNKIFLDGTVTGHTYIYQVSDDVLGLTVGGSLMMKLTQDTANKVEIQLADLEINSGKKFLLDGATGEHTWITESSDDVLDIVVGDDMIFQITESGADGNTIDIDNACIGFTQLEPTYDASNTIVDFRHSNKQNLTFGAGNIGHLVFYFPLVSGNFQLLIKQDGTGSRTLTGAYKVFAFDETSASGSATAIFAGGSSPTLTTDANHVDILSFYWDADNEIAYGVATLDFQF